MEGHLQNTERCKTFMIKKSIDINLYTLESKQIYYYSQAQG